MSLNLLNTTIMNTKYGIIEGILPYSSYFLQVNATNRQGFVLSNRVRVETFKSGPQYLMPPQLVASTSSSIQIEWLEPILINSDDRIIFYMVHINAIN